MCSGQNRTQRALQELNKQSFLGFQSSLPAEGRIGQRSPCRRRAGAPTPGLSFSRRGCGTQRHSVASGPDMAGMSIIHAGPLEQPLWVPWASVRHLVSSPGDKTFPKLTCSPGQGNMAQNARIWISNWGRTARCLQVREEAPSCLPPIARYDSLI